MQKKREQHEDAAQKVKNHAIKSLMGLRKSLGTPGKYPLFPLPPPPTSLSGPAHTHTFEMLQPIYSPHTAHSVFKLQWFNSDSMLIA